MAFCGDCGSQIKKDEKFCPKCGKAVAGTTGTSGGAANEQSSGDGKGMITIINPHKSSLGLDANLLSAIVFAGVALFTWIPYVHYAAWAIPLVFFFLEKESKFVKFSCITALIIEIVAVIISIIFAVIIFALTPRFSSIFDYYSYDSLYRNLGLISFFGVLAIIFVVVFILLYVFLAIMAFMYKQVKLPIVGSIAEKAAEKLDSIKN